MGALPDGTPVIVSSGEGDPHGAGVAADRRHPGRGAATGATRWVSAAAVGAPPDSTPVIVSGYGDRTMRVWRLADGTPVGQPLTGHTGPVFAVAVGALPDGTPVIVSGGGYRDGTVRVWRLADGTRVGKPLDRPRRPRCTRWRWGRCETAHR